MQIFVATTGSGTDSMGALSSIGILNTVDVNAGFISLKNAMSVVNFSLISETSIMNEGAPVPPTPPSPEEGGSSNELILKGSRYFAIVGLYDAQFTLARDYFFFPYLLSQLLPPKGGSL